MNGFDKMNKKLLASQVEDALMDDILNKPVPIGEKIPNEYELAEKYGVGRSTIRETVKSLVSKGILEVRQGSGTYVIGTHWKMIHWAFLNMKISISWHWSCLKSV